MVPSGLGRFYLDNSMKNEPRERREKEGGKPGMVRDGIDRTVPIEMRDC